MLHKGVSASSIQLQRLLPEWKRPLSKNERTGNQIPSRDVSSDGGFNTFYGVKTVSTT